MDALEQLELWTGRLLGLFAAGVLVVLLAGIARGLRRPAGRESGRAAGLVRSPLFYVVVSVAYFAFLGWLWRPLPVDPSPAVRWTLLVTGFLLAVCGLGMVLWGRLALGREYFVSSGMGAQLFAGHKLVTQGPFAMVRHPMYLGLLLFGLGGVLLYRTWTFAFMTLQVFGLALRARQEERTLQAEFGEQWLAYTRRVPAWLPRIDLQPARIHLRQLRIEQSALLEVGLLFLPAIPAYLWMWPNVQGESLLLANVVTYVYVLAGTLFIGLRRWSWQDLGVNTKGLWVSLLSGAALIAGRMLVVLAVDWGPPRQQLTMLRVLADLGFYLLLVGPVEELLFRGLVYRALLNRRGLRWAIWGSALAFVLWHIFGQGPLVGAAVLLYGLIFALMRWRAGGILGAAIVHGWMDIASLWLLPDGDVLGLGRPQLPHPGWLFLGLALIAAVPLYLWLLHSRVERLLQRVKVKKNINASLP